MLGASMRVLTQYGFEPIRNIKVGSQVYGTDGRLHNVIEVQRKLAKGYHILLSDDMKIVCTEDTKWRVFEQDLKGYSDVTVKDLGKEDYFYISSTMPIESGEKSVDIDESYQSFMRSGTITGDLLLSSVETRVGVADKIMGGHHCILVDVGKLLSNTQILCLRYLFLSLGLSCVVALREGTSYDVIVSKYPRYIIETTPCENDIEAYDLILDDDEWKYITDYYVPVG